MGGNAAVRQKKFAPPPYKVVGDERPEDDFMSAAAPGSPAIDAGPDPSARPAAAGRGGWGQFWGWGLLLAALGGGGYLLAPRIVEMTAAKTAGAGKGGPRTISVVTATVRRGDLPIYLDSLGAVAALNTVVVRDRKSVV